MKEKGKAKNLGVVKPSSINHYIKVTKDKSTASNICKRFWEKCNVKIRVPLSLMIKLWAKMPGAPDHWQIENSNEC